MRCRVDRAAAPTPAPTHAPTGAIRRRFVAASIAHPTRATASLLAGALVVALIALVLPLAACEPYRIEHHYRPGFYQSASSDRLPDRLVKPDGTVIVYGGRRKREKEVPAEAGELIQIRQEDDSGNVTLLSILPDHVIANAMTCIRGREWEVMWTQLISERSRKEFLGDGRTTRDFEEYMEANREPLMEMLNRMAFGYSGPDVIIEQARGGGVRVRLGPRVSTQFKFTEVHMVSEAGGLRLLNFQ